MTERPQNPDIFAIVYPSYFSDPEQHFRFSHTLSFPIDDFALKYDTETLVTRMLLKGMIEYLASSAQLDSALAQS